LERPFTLASLPHPGTKNYSLYLKFAHVLGVRIDDVALDSIPVVNGTIGDAKTYLLSATQRAHLRDALESLSDTENPSDPIRRDPAIPEGAHCTVIGTILGAQFVLYHTESIVALCYDPNGQVVHLPGL
jgi:hypothetical protein